MHSTPPQFCETSTRTTESGQTKTLLKLLILLIAMLLVLLLCAAMVSALEPVPQLNFTSYLGE